MGLFDYSNPDDMAYMTLASGLLGGKGNLGSILGKSLMGSQGAYQSAQESKNRTGLANSQMSHMQAVLQQMEEERKQRQKLEEFRGAIPDPATLAMRQAFPQGASPTNANAAQIPQVDPLSQLSYGAMKAGALSPLDYIKAQQKDRTPIKLGKDDRLFDPASYKELVGAAPEKDDANIRQLKLIYGEGTPEYQTALKSYGDKISTHQPTVSVSYGAPVAGTDEKGNPVFFQPSKDGKTPPAVLPGVRPPSNVTGAIRKDIADNAVALQKLDAAMGLLQKNPDAMGLKNYLGDAAMQRMDPTGVETRAAIADIGSQKIHDRSGASVTISEAPRLKPFVPDVRDTPEAAAIKLKRLRQEYASMQEALTGGKSISEASKSDNKVRKYNPATGKIE